MPSLGRFTDRTLDVVVDIAGEKIKLVVRPYKWTIDEEARLIGANTADDARDRLLSFFCSMVASWDLTFEEGGDPIPLTPEALADLPTVLLQNILQEAKEAITFRKSR